MVRNGRVAQRKFSKVSGFELFRAWKKSVFFRPKGENFLERFFFCNKNAWFPDVQVSWKVHFDPWCTAGARRRWDYANLPLTTTPNLLDSLTFLSTDAIHVRNMFFQELKKRCSKVDPKLRAFAKDMYTMTTFFQFLKNLVFKTPLSSEVCPPLICHPQKVIIFRTPDTGRTNGRTDTRNIWFWLADGRKERFAQ